MAAVGGAVVVAHGMNRRGDRREDAATTVATAETTAEPAAAGSSVTLWKPTASVSASRGDLVAGIPRRHDKWS